MFGIVPSSVYVWVDYGLTVLMEVFKDKTVREFRVKWPGQEEMDDSYNLLTVSYTHLTLPTILLV